MIKTKLPQQVAVLLKQQNQKLATVESCTGGWVAMSLTAIAGSSDYYERGFVTYSNAAKQEQVGVAPELITRHGAVSEEVALAMAQGGLVHSHADISLSITGIAGPGGGSTEKPVGMVCFAIAGPGGKTISWRSCFKGDRETVRQQAVDEVLTHLLDFLK